MKEKLKNPYAKEMLPNTLLHVEWLETIDRLSNKISVPGCSFIFSTKSRTTFGPSSN